MKEERMLDNETKRRIDTARDILVGRIPDPKAQVEQITIALIYKFMDDMDAEAEELGGKRKFFSGDYKQYSWKKLMAHNLGGFDVLALYSEAIQKMNVNPNIPQLFRDIFKNAYLPYRDPETLKSFLKTINGFEYDHSEKLGDAFEYLLSVLGSQGDAGQFRTPRHIIDFMVYLIDPKKNETILDPACGTAGFLISSYKHIIKTNSKDYKSEEDRFQFTNGNGEKYRGDKLTPDQRKQLAKNIKGYDISPDMVRLSLVNLYLHGFNDPKIEEYDTLTSEDKWNEHADIILANPPFMSPKGGIKPHKRFSIESSRSEVLFVDYIAEHLTPTGRAAVIVPEGIIFQSGTAYKSLRKMLVEKYLYAVVSLPAGVFNPYSGVKTSILLMDKTLARRTNKLLFAKVENDGFDLGAQRRANNKSELPDIAKAVKDFVKSINDGKEFNGDEYSNLVVATKEKIGENGEWNLSGERYKASDLRDSKFPKVLLGDITNMEKGTSITKKDTTEGFYPVIAGGQQAAYFHGTYNREGETITVSASGAYAGFINFFNTPIFASDCTTIKSINEELASTKFLYLLLKSMQDKIYLLQKGGGQPHVYAKDMQQLIIPLPPLEVQMEIVAEIEGYQKIIDGARQVVENYKPQIQIDPSWPMVELGEVTTVVSGFAFDSKDFSKDNKAKCIKITNVGVGEFVFEDENKLPIKFLEKHKEYIVNSGDIVISLTRSIISSGLKVCIVPDGYDKALLNQRVAALKGIDKVSNINFIYYYMRSHKAYEFIENKSRSLMQPNLSVKDLKEFPIPLPSLNIQNAIVEKLDEEFRLVSTNTRLIEIFEQKIKNKIASVWGE
jgi:type I restriction enzyme M protein